MLDKETDILVELLGRDDPKVQALLWAARDPKMQGAVRNMLRNMARQQGWDPDDPPAFALPRRISTSDYPLGRAKCGELVGEEVGLSQKDIDAGGGIGIFGISGVGKSTLTKVFILNFLGKKSMTDIQKNTALILDAHGEYRDLMRFFSPEELVWMTADELGLNPFEVPRDASGRPVMPPEKWVGCLKEWMRQLWLGEISVDVGAGVAIQVYRKRGVLTGGDDYPCLSDIIEAVELEDAHRGSDKAKGREKVLDRLTTMRLTLPGLDVRRSRNVHQLFGQRTVILDLTETKDAALPLLFNFLVIVLTASFSHEPGELIRRLLIMEEAHLYLGGHTDKRTADVKETAGTGVLRSLRKAGFCGVVVNQLISDLAPAVVGNLSSVICMRLAQRACISRAGSALGLQRWQEQELSRLPAREALMRVSRYPDPIHLLVKDLKNA